MNNKRRSYLTTYPSFVKRLITKDDTSVDVDGGEDEIHLIYSHWEEGRKKETTLIVTDIIDDYVD